MCIRNKYLSFNKSLIGELCKIPVVGTTYVPQGVCAINKYIIIACYDFNRKDNSILFIVNDNNVKRIYLDSKMHCGGIAYHKKTDSLFIAGDSKDNKSFINRYCGKNILNAKDLSTVAVEKIFCVDENNSLYSSSARHSSPSYLTIHNDELLVGNYVSYNEINKVKPIIKRYKILSTGDLSTFSKTIINPFSNTQGLCLMDYNNKTYYIFSRSFGTKRNSLLNICLLDHDASKFINTNVIVLPAMSEQVNIYNGNIMCIFESCSDFYSKISITYNDGVYLLDFSKLLEFNDSKLVFSKGKSLFVSNIGIDVHGKS